MNVPILRRTTGGILVVGWIAVVALHWPGELSPDSVIQLLEGRLGHYNTWHPPVMAWLLGLGDAISPGAGLFILFDATMAYGALVSLLWLKPSRASLMAAGAAVMLCLLPQFLLYQGIVWKDVLFGDAILAGFVCLAHGEDARHRIFLLALAAVFLALGALARQNGIILLPFAAAAVGTRVWQASHRWRPTLAWAGGWILTTAILMTGASAALDQRSARDSGRDEQIELLQAYDLTGAASRGLALEKLQDRAPDLQNVLRSIGVSRYTPQRNDPLAASVAITAALQDAPTGAVSAQWEDLISAHPLLYLELRAEVFRWVFLTPDIVACRPLFAGIEGPADALKTLGLAPRRNGKDQSFIIYAAAFMGTPVFSHPFWALIALGCLVVLVIRARPADFVFVIFIIGTFAFVASFFFIALACDYRYLYALDLCAMATLFYLSLDPTVRS